MFTSLITRFKLWLDSNHRLVVWFGLGLLVLLGVLAMYQLVLSKQTVKTPELESRYNWVIPGSTSQAQLVKRAGEPVYQFKQDDYDVLTYNTPYSSYAPDRFYVKDNNIQLVELNFNPIQSNYPSSAFIAFYGEPEKYMYDKSTMVLAAPKRGVAGYANSGGKVVSVKRFRPMSMKSYLETWGQGLTDKPAQELPSGNGSHKN